MAFKFLGKFFAAIGNFFVGLFNAAQKTWDKVEPALQESMLIGSSLVAIINDNVGASPAFIFTLMQQKYPHFTKEKLQEMLAKGTEGIAITQGVINADILVTIQNIAALLGQLEGKGWANISQTIAAGIAAFLAPKNTKFAIISALMEFVYQTFIKKRA